MHTYGKHMELGCQKENLFNIGDISMFPYMLFLFESLVWSVPEGVPLFKRLEEK